MAITSKRELEKGELRAVRKLVKDKCANFDREYGCLVLEEPCPMFVIGYTHSALCKYFRNVVLAYDPKLRVLFQTSPSAICKNCGKSFPRVGNGRYCTAECAASARRKRGAERVRKHRKKKTQL